MASLLLAVPTSRKLSQFVLIGAFVHKKVGSLIGIGDEDIDIAIIVIVTEGGASANFVCNCLVQFVRVAKSVQHWAQLLATEDSTHQYDEYKGTTVHCSYCRIGG